MAYITYIRFIPKSKKPYKVKVYEGEWLRKEEDFETKPMALDWIKRFRFEADVRDITHIGIGKAVQAQKDRDNALAEAVKAEQRKHYDPSKPRLIKKVLA